MSESAAPSPTRATPLRLFMLGATGTIGRATVRALVRQGHEVVCFGRPRGDGGGRSAATPPAPRARPSRQAPSVEQSGPLLPPGVTLRSGDVTDPVSVARDGIRGESFDGVVSCMASRTGVPADAWAIDHRAHMHVLEVAKAAGVPRFVLLSAICVQKPLLAFQHAKLAFEAALMDSGLTWSIVRPTAFFKSVSGQVPRVMRGRPFLLFGDGTLTASKPISDDDLAGYLVGCLTDPARQDRILPIGGPGPAITPKQQGEHLFALLGREPRFRSVPVALLDGIAGVLGGLGRVIPPLAPRAELARIGRYYATESMLLWDPVACRYDADATPSTGHETLLDHYAQLVRGDADVERGDHSVF